MDSQRSEVPQSFTKPVRWIQKRVQSCCPSWQKGFDTTEGNSRLPVALGLLPAHQPVHLSSTHPAPSSTHPAPSPLRALCGEGRGEGGGRLPLRGCKERRVLLPGGAQMCLAFFPFLHAQIQNRYKLHWSQQGFSNVYYVTWKVLISLFLWY